MEDFTKIPEGGSFRRVYTAPADGRPPMTLIEYRMAAGEGSRPHSLDADETWIHLSGDPVTVLCAAEGQPVCRVLNPGEQFFFPANALMAAWTRGEHGAMLACMCVPGYEDEGFRLWSAAEVAARWPEAAVLLPDFLCDEKKP